MYFEVASLPVILDDLCSRFIINVPDEELASVERICFQIEQAHWFYEDFIREINTSLPTFTLKNFSAKIFKHCPLLHQWAHEHEKAYNDFLQYKFRVPVCGAIILNEAQDKCLLVKGWTSRSGWGFPRGKINKDEPDSTCAIREVLEETGFDITPYLDEDQFIEVVIHEQRIKLFIASGVPESTAFVPMTRKEISKIEWHRISDLPTAKVKSGGSGIYDTAIQSIGGGAASKSNNRYYMIIPFVSRLKSWINRRNKGKSNKRPSSLKSSGSSSRLSAVDSQTNAENQIKSLLGMVNGHGSHSDLNNDYMPHGQTHLAGDPSYRNGTDPESMLKSMLRISDSTSSLPSMQTPSPPTITILKRNPNRLNNASQTSLSSERVDESANHREPNLGMPQEMAISTPPMLAENQLKSLLGINKPPKSSPFVPVHPSGSDFPNRATQPVHEPYIDSASSMPPHPNPNPNSISLLHLFGKPTNSVANGQPEPDHLNSSPLLALFENAAGTKSNNQPEPSKPNASAQSLLTLLGKSPTPADNNQTVPNQLNDSAQSLLTLLQQPSNTTNTSETGPAQPNASAQSLLALLQQPSSSTSTDPASLRHQNVPAQSLPVPFERSPISTTSEQVEQSSSNASVQSLLALLGKSSDSTTSSQAESSHIEGSTQSLLSSPHQLASSTYSMSIKSLPSPTEGSIIGSPTKSTQLSASAQSLLNLHGQPAISTTNGQTEPSQSIISQPLSMLHEQSPDHTPNDQTKSDQTVSSLPNELLSSTPSDQTEPNCLNTSIQPVLTSAEKSPSSTTNSEPEPSQLNDSTQSLLALLKQSSNATNPDQTELSQTNTSTQSLLSLLGKPPSVSSSHPEESSQLNASTQSLLALLGKSPVSTTSDLIEPSQPGASVQSPAVLEEPSNPSKIEQNEPNQQSAPAQSLLNLLAKPLSSTSNQTETIPPSASAQPLLVLLGQPSNIPKNRQPEPSQPNSSAQSLLSLLSESSPVASAPATTSASNSNRRTSHTTMNAANELLGFVSSQSPSQIIPESPKFEQSQMLKGILGIDTVGQVKPKSRATENAASSSTDHIKSLLNIDSTPTVA